jgi:pSer/pThr/pTyr-binding forkhead associated (FHA) protein
MIECPFCHASHVFNTIFCCECGTYLLKDSHSETDSFDTDELEWVGETTEHHDFDAPGQAGAEPQTIRLRIGPARKQVEMPLDKIIHVGRMDPAQTVLPEIDLSDYDVVDHGVSRRHARIMKQEAKVVIEDLGSVNGTFLNGERLAAYLPKALCSGDLLQLGKLLIEIEILKMERTA